MANEWSNEIFAKNLRRYMESRGKNQKELAEIVGVSAPTMHDWLKGKKMPRMGKIEVMANYFGCEKSDLIEDKKEKPTIQKDDGLSGERKKLLERIKTLPDDKVQLLLQIAKSIE